MIRANEAADLIRWLMRQRMKTKERKPKRNIIATDPEWEAMKAGRRSNRCADGAAKQRSAE